MDLSVREWCFWLIAADGVEMRCSWPGAFGPQFSFYNMENGIDLTLNVTESEARHIKKAVETASSGI
jgi:hypothetical protein